MPTLFGAFLAGVWLLGGCAATSVGMGVAKSDFKLRQYSELDACVNRTNRFTGSLGVCYEIDGMTPPYVRFQRCGADVVRYTSSDDPTCVNGTTTNATVGACLAGIRVDCPAASGALGRASSASSAIVMWMALLIAYGLFVPG